MPNRNFMQYGTDFGAMWFREERRLLGKGWRRQKPNRNFMRMVLISGQCEPVCS